MKTTIHYDLQELINFGGSGLEPSKLNIKELNSILSSIRKELTDTFSKLTTYQLIKYVTKHIDIYDKKGKIILQIKDIDIKI